MIDSKILIYGFPRSGTKLLARVLEQQGYFNFREFFDTFSSEIESRFPVAVRVSLKKQLEISNRPASTITEKLYIQSTEVQNRVKRFRDCANDYPRSTLTVHSTTFDLFPALFELFHDRHFLCTKRENKFEQLISRCLTEHFKNYDGEQQSQSITINAPVFEKFYFQLKKTEQTQDFLISIGKGTLVDFDQLISGSLDLGFNYHVDSVDQHTNPESLINNYDEILGMFNQLESKHSTN